MDDVWGSRLLGNFHTSWGRWTSRPAMSVTNESFEGKKRGSQWQWGLRFFPSRLVEQHGRAHCGCPSLPVATSQSGHGRSHPPCGAPTSGEGHPIPGKHPTGFHRRPAKCLYPTFLFGDMRWVYRSLILICVPAEARTCQIWRQVFHFPRRKWQTMKRNFTRIYPTGQVTRRALIGHGPAGKPRPGRAQCCYLHVACTKCSNPTLVTTIYTLSNWFLC